MKDPKNYIQHPGKVIETDKNFTYVMAITLNPLKNYKDGIVRCITNREGDLTYKGATDHSELHKIKGEDLENFKIEEKLNIKNETEIIAELKGEDDFLGLEDPDIWIDPDANLIHVYFTIPIKPLDEKKKTKIHLGHAEGKDLDSLVMTPPVLMGTFHNSAKEVSIAPINKNGFRYNLIESRDREHKTRYSVIKVVKVRDMRKSWEYGDIVFHPGESNMPWIAGHASPGPLFSKNFIDIGEGKLIGIINGCEADQKIEDETKYGNFSIGLFIYDYENGKIDWVSEKPFIQDSESGKGGGRAITFASQFVETEKGKGILYAHVDDSFVRAYTLDADKIKSLLPL